MVAQFPTESTNSPKNLAPQIKVDVRTFTELPATRMCVIDIEVSNVQKNLAVATFSRIFTYAQSLANSDINPVDNVNQALISVAPTFSNNKPESGLNLYIDSSEKISVCSLSLKISNLRLDFMDEYFGATLSYITNAITSDMNPNA